MAGLTPLASNLITRLSQSVLRKKPHTGVRSLRWTPRLVAKFWNGLSESGLLDRLSFSRLAGPWLLQILASHVPTGKRVLDFGAGDGDFSHLLLKAGYQTAVYEPSVARAEVLQARLGHEPGFLGVIGPDNHAQFDVITVIEVIEHVLDQDMADFLKTLERLLAPDGILIVTTPNNEDLFLNSVLDPVRGTLFHRWQHQRSFSKETLNLCLFQQSFSPVVVHEVELSDQVFAEQGAGLGTNPDYANLVRAKRSLKIGCENQLIWIGQRDAERTERHPYPPLTLRIKNELVLPDFGLNSLAPVVPTVRQGGDRYCYSLSPRLINQDEGHLFSTDLPNMIPVGGGPDGERGVNLILCENGRRLGPRNSLHAGLRAEGGGGYSHWGRKLLFTSSDGTDPRKNGREYSIYLRDGHDDRMETLSIVSVSIEPLDHPIYRIALPHFIPFPQSGQRDGGIIAFTENYLPFIETTDGDLQPGHFAKRPNEIIFRPHADDDPTQNGHSYRILYLA